MNNQLSYLGRGITNLYFIDITRYDYFNSFKLHGQWIMVMVNGNGHGQCYHLQIDMVMFGLNGEIKSSHITNPKYTQR